jgi:hypothetical protein
VNRSCRALLAAALLGAASAAGSAVHVVAPGQSLAQALRMALDGDEIQLLPGEHRGQVGVIEQKQLTLRGVGSRPVLLAAGAHAEGKAILVVRNGEVLIENIEFRGARVPDGNGAGIRFERGRLTVSQCSFIDNQNGILTANFADAELEVRDSIFAQAPAGVSLPHLLYVGRIARVTITGSRFSGGARGHLVKSRALEHHVRYNHLVDGARGRASYELEFPNGGLAFVVGNVIGQSAQSGNPTLLSFGAEGSTDARPHALHVVNNTFLNEGLRPGIFVRVHESRLKRDVEQRLANNLFLGLGVPDTRLSDLLQGNYLASPTVLDDPAAGAWSLNAMSQLRGRGVEPGNARGVDLRPAFEFTLPAGTRAVAPPARWSPGAYQD